VGVAKVVFQSMFGDGYLSVLETNANSVVGAGIIQ
jgi:hypothetical protein